jgi:hypothetical protein
MGTSRKFDRLHQNGLQHDNTHQRPANLDPKHNGPFLDDIRADEARARHTARNAKSKASNDTDSK